jgi:hypothetical protein
LSRLSAKAVVIPWAIARNDSMRANEWASGRNSRCTQPSCTGVAFVDAVTAAMWLPCVCTTPLGGPVVPEVYTIDATSAGIVLATRSASVDLWTSAFSRPIRCSVAHVITDLGGCAAS